MNQDEIDKQWPGFKVSCQMCGSQQVEMQDTRGWSRTSGTWGEVSLVCLSCDHRTEILSSGAGCGY